MAKFLLLLAAAIGALMAANWFIKTPPKQSARTLKRALWMIAGLALVALAATGRLAWIFALIGSFIAFLPRLVPLLRYVPILAQLVKWLQSQGALGAQPVADKKGQSRVASEYLRMVMDHKTGEINGEVLQGSLQGAWLSELDRAELQQLFQELQSDNDSLALYIAYMDRLYPDWRDATDGEPLSPDTSGDMTRDEALAVLGLEGSPDKEQVVQAHRRLIAKMHPDRGGSTFLAAKINQAKDLLLGSLS